MEYHAQGCIIKRTGVCVCEERERTCDMRMGSEKRPPDDDGSVDGFGRSFLEGGGPSSPGFVEACLASSESRSEALEGPDLEPACPNSKSDSQRQRETYLEQKTRP